MITTKNKEDAILVAKGLILQDQGFTVNILRDTKRWYADNEVVMEEDEYCADFITNNQKNTTRTYKTKSKKKTKIKP